MDLYQSEWSCDYICERIYTCNKFNFISLSLIEQNLNDEPTMIHAIIRFPKYSIEHPNL